LPNAHNFLEEISLRGLYTVIYPNIHLCLLGYRFI
jgi:hypothetical protein